MSTIPSNPSNTFTAGGANAYPDLDITRWGVNNAVPQAGIADQARLQDGNDLWLPTWSGEVLHAYDQQNMFESMVDTRVLSSGTSVEFPITGTIELTPAWEAGVELSGGGSSSTKFSIGLDKRPTAAHFELDNIDVMIQQFDFRSELARQAGLTLANERDRQIARLLVNGALTGSRMHVRSGDEGVDPADLASGIDSRYGGKAYYVSNGTDVADWANESSVDETSALYVLSAIEAEQVRGRSLDLPEESLVVVVRPALFNQIRRLGIASPNFANDSFFSTTGGRGDARPFAGSPTSMPAMTAGLSYLNATILSSNHLPQDLVFAAGASAGQGEAADANYAGNMRGVAGLMFRKGGVASIKKQGMKVDTVNDIRRNSVFTVASMFHGGGVLRPEFCSVLLTASQDSGADNTVSGAVDGRFANKEDLVVSA